MKINGVTIRILIFGLLLMIGYAVLLSSMWMVQIEMGEEHRERISKQSIRRIRIPAVRGRIYSSDGYIIADNRPAYDLAFHLEEMRQPGRRSKTVKYILDRISQTGAEIGRKVNFKEEDILQYMNKPGLPMVVFENLTSLEMARLAEMREPVNGMAVLSRPLRFYPGGRAFCHVTGYTGLEDPKKADDKEEFSYYVPDLIGKDGIERQLDRIEGTPVELRGLCGEPGGSMVMVDHRGYIYETLSREEAICGNNAILTIDWRAQKIAYRLLEGKMGAIVLMDADNGALLAMASSPNYDPNDFVGRISKDRWNSYMQDKNRPMFNRVAMGAYTPGSIVKPLVALGLLENHSDISPVVCDGVTAIGNARVKCSSWRHGGHGQVDLEDALAVSCNDFFIEKGMVLGLDKLREIFLAAGLGRKTGFILPESAGLIPTREDKLRLYKTKWNEYDTGLLSMGQGIVLLTPLQIVCYVSAIANGGTLWKPRLIKEITSPSGHVLFVAGPERNGTLGVSAENLERVRNGMWKVVNESYGSGKKAKNSKIELYGKSGTGEVGAAGQRYNNTWFVAFGSYGEKNYAMVVFVDHGVSGGSSCAPLVSQFFDEWLEE